MLVPLLLIMGAALQSASAERTPPVPVKSPHSWVTNDDYPAEALRTESSGAVDFTLDIAADGTVTNCIVTASTATSLLDATTCHLLTMRARFVPARDRKRKPIAGQWSSRFVWKIPEGNDLPVDTLPATFGYEVILTVDELGNTVKCEVLRNEKQPPNLCDAYFPLGKPSQRIMLGGKPVRAKMHITLLSTIEADEPK